MATGRDSDLGGRLYYGRAHSGADRFTSHGPPLQVCYHLQMLHLFLPLLLGKKREALTGAESGRQHSGEKRGAGGEANGNANGHANGHAVKTE